MKKYKLITEDTILRPGDKIRRPLGKDNYDYLVVGEYNQVDDVFEINLPNKPRLIDAISVYAFMSKNNMMAQGYEVLS